MYVPRLCLWIHRQHNTLKNNCLLCRRSSYQPNISDCTHAACEAIVNPLSAFCLCARSDAQPGKALSPVVVIPPCRI